MRPLLILFAALVSTFNVFMTVGCGSAVEASAPVDQDDTHRRYHDGERWVELIVALDRLHVERSGASEDQRSIEVYLLRKPAASAAALDDVARQMLAAQKDIRSISAYVLSGDAFGAQPMRLTNQFALRGSAGQDLVVLAANHGGKIIENVDYSPDTAIGVATGTSLFAALVVAEALRQQPGVVLAMPLIERAHPPRPR